MNPQNTSAQTKLDLQLEIAHVLLIGVVGYSKLLVDEQIELPRALNQARVIAKCSHVWSGHARATLAWELVQNDHRAPCVVVRNAVDIPSILLV